MTDLLLGHRVRDKITGFVGILSSRTTWLYGCVRIGIKSTDLTEGKPIPEEIFDIGQIEFVDDGIGGLPWRDEPPVLGKRVQDRISGNRGTCCGYVQVLYGLDELFYQTPGLNKEGKPYDFLGIPIEQAIIEEEVIAPPPRQSRPPGGPRVDRPTRPSIHIGR